MQWTHNYNPSSTRPPIKDYVKNITAIHREIPIVGHGILNAFSRCRSW